jgi:hypothetical protein
VPTGTVSEPITSLTPGLARSSIELMSLSFGTAITSSFVANFTGFSSSPSLASWSGNLVLAAA